LGRKALETKLKKRRRVKSEMFNPEVATLQKDRSEGVLPRRKYTPRRKVRSEVFYRGEKFDPRCFTNE
jgi:hypothetical protein